MPVSQTSRYLGLPVLRVTDARRGDQPAIALRPLPDPPAAPYQHPVAALESLEYLSWRYLGRSEDFWRIADANGPRFPLDLRPGDTVAIPSSGDPGLVTRTRRF